MAWNTCSTHAILGVCSYICFLVATIGGAIFLLTSRLQSLKELKKFRQVVQQVRSQLNLVYLTVGLVLLSVAIVLGVSQHGKTASLWWPIDLKQVVSIIIWWYYLVSIAIAWVLRLRKDNQAGRFIAWLSLWGLLLLLINGILVNYLLPTFHHFL